MDPISLALSVLGGLGGIFGNRGQQQQTSGTSSTSQFGTSSTSGVSGTTYQYDPTLRDAILEKYNKMLTTDPDLTGYESSGIQDINRISDIERRSTEEELAARGVTGGPAVATALNNVNSRRFGDIIKFKSGIPLLKHQMNNDILSKGIDLFSAIPKNIVNESYGYGGNTGSSTTNQQGTVNLPGNMIGGGLEGLGGMLAFLAGIGRLGGGGGNIRLSN